MIQSLVPDKITALHFMSTETVKKLVEFVPEDSLGGLVYEKLTTALIS